MLDCFKLKKLADQGSSPDVSSGLWLSITLHCFINTTSVVNPKLDITVTSQVLFLLLDLTELLQSHRRP